MRETKSFCVLQCPFSYTCHLRHVFKTTVCVCCHLLYLPYSPKASLLVWDGKWLANSFKLTSDVISVTTDAHSLFIAFYNMLVEALGPFCSSAMWSKLGGVSKWKPISYFCSPYCGPSRDHHLARVSNKVYIFLIKNNLQYDFGVRKQRKPEKM